MIVSNKKFKENLNKIKEETINSLEPIVKEQGNKLMESLKELTNTIITTAFEKRRNKTK
jgi:hypothetical protein